MLNICDLKIGQHVKEDDKFYALIHDVQRVQTIDGKPYLNIILQDTTGTIQGKKWSVVDHEVVDIVEGVVVQLVGEIVSYRNKPQFKIKEIKVNTAQNKEDYIPSAPQDIPTLREEINRYLVRIENVVLHDITKKLVDKFYEQYFEYPAASKNHHEFKSGLAYHVKTMLDLGKVICDVYPDLDRDLLYAGVMLHDIGKVIELSGYESTFYTNEGKLLGHITIASNEIAVMAKELGYEDKEEVMLLQHMVLAHHGKLEFGSPKVPMLREAEILTYIDNIDARMIMMNDALKDTEYGEFTSRIFPLENRQFFKPFYYNKL